MPVKLSELDKKFWKELKKNAGIKSSGWLKKADAAVGAKIEALNKARGKFDTIGTTQELLKYIDALEELSRVIPDGTWLNGLQFNNRRIIIQGQSPSASSLIQRIEASAFFQNVSFVSPVTKDTANGLERFQIAADAANGRFSEKSH